MFYFKALPFINCKQKLKILFCSVVIIVEKLVIFKKTNKNFSFLDDVIKKWRPFSTFFIDPFFLLIILNIPAKVHGKISSGSGVR